MNSKDREILEEIKRKIPPQVKSHLRKFIAYGSRARGDYQEDSDLDVAALVDEKTREIDDKIDDVVYDVMADHDFKPVISLRVFSEASFQEFLKMGYSFYENVEQEGILI